MKDLEGREEGCKTYRCEGGIAFMAFFWEDVGIDICGLGKCMIYYNMYKTALYTLWVLFFETCFSWLRVQNIDSFSCNTATIYSCAWRRIVASCWSGFNEGDLITRRYIALSYPTVISPSI
jgi:hypothetical protein